MVRSSNPFAALVNSQLVCHQPAEILNFVEFIVDFLWFVYFRCLRGPTSLWHKLLSRTNKVIIFHYYDHNYGRLFLSGKCTENKLKNSPSQPKTSTLIHISPLQAVGWNRKATAVNGYSMRCFTSVKSLFAPKTWKRFHFDLGINTTTYEVSFWAWMIEWTLLQWILNVTNLFIKRSQV